MFSIPFSVSFEVMDFEAVLAKIAPATDTTIQAADL
jgi:hypothetical protein